MSQISPADKGEFVNNMSIVTSKLCSKYLFLIVVGGISTYPAALAQVKPTPSAAPTSDKNVVGARRLAFEVVSIRPSKRGLFGSSLPQMETTEIQADGYRATNQALTSTIAIAYLPLTYSYSFDTAPSNEPDWVHGEYDIQAKISPGDRADWQKQGPQKEMLKAMLRSMLEDRCKLVVHWVPSQTLGYALVVGKHGSRLKKATPGEPIPPNGQPVRIGNVTVPGTSYFPVKRGDLTTDIPFYNISMEVMADVLSAEASQPVLDQTGLKGNYNVVLHRRVKGDEADSDPGPSMPWDLETLGLKLVPVKVSTRRPVIDHIERPSANE